MKGKLIVFEGADNLGKTTQIEMLYKYLKDEKKIDKIYKTREPGGTIFGSKLRKLLLESKEILPSKTQLFLFEADRNYHYENIIKPYLEQGYIILCDRFYLSTLVYQSKLGNLSELDVKYFNKYATDNLLPNKAFVFHGTPLSTDARDEFEKQVVNNNHSILNNYYMVYGKNLPNHILINANRDKDVVFNDILAKLENEIPSL